MEQKEIKKEAIKAFENALKEGTSSKNKVLFRFPFYQDDILSNQIIKIIADSIFDIKLKKNNNDQSSTFLR